MKKDQSEHPWHRIFEPIINFDKSSKEFAMALQRELDYQDEPFNTLETDPAFIERRDRVCKVLCDSTLRSDLAWLINRAYYVGYQNNLTDENNNKGDKENGN